MQTWSTGSAETRVKTGEGESWYGFGVSGEEECLVLQTRKEN
jgi:hypothetical protein